MSVEAMAAPVAVHRSLPPEEAARADFYALLARLFHAPPDAALLASLGAAGPIPPGGDAALARAWDDLVRASSVMDPDAAREEYETLFVGMGRSPVSMFAGFYSGAPSIDHPRVRIQADLAALGLGRPDSVVEPEDHFAGLLDVMRVLVSGGAGRAPSSVAEQKRFFQAHLDTALAKFFAAVGRAPEANYYRPVAAVGAAFTVLETESFSLE
ncbi:MAG: molecular chaperone TorD family protein [Pseudomonadota bacterium]|nr:molecular chaperone TorD family protein [Pseudomonadota bacterium]